MASEKVCGRCARRCVPAHSYCPGCGTFLPAATPAAAAGELVHPAGTRSGSAPPTSTGPAVLPSTCGAGQGDAQDAKDGGNSFEDKLKRMSYEEVQSLNIDTRNQRILFEYILVCVWFVTVLGAMPVLFVVGTVLAALLIFWAHVQHKAANDELQARAAT